jgi:hypothetical protein
LHGEFRINGMGEFAPHFFGFPPNDRSAATRSTRPARSSGCIIAPNCSIISSSISRFCDPIYFEDVAQDFPGVNVCLTAPACALDRNGHRARQSKVNVYWDVGDWQTRPSKDPIDAVLRFVRRALDSDARHKISSAPTTLSTLDGQREDLGRRLHRRSDRRGMPFSDQELHLLFSENPQST